MAAMICCFAVISILGSKSAAQAPLAPAKASPPATTRPSLDRDDVSAWLDGFVPAMLQRDHVPGAAVVVVKDGSILYEKGYGYADVAKLFRSIRSAQRSATALSQSCSPGRRSCSWSSRENSISTAT